MGTLKFENNRFKGTVVLILRDPQFKNKEMPDSQPRP